MKKTVLIAVAMLIGQPAHAYFVTGNDLFAGWLEDQRAARSDPNTNTGKAWQYSYYVLGVYDTLEMKGDVCNRPNMTRGQITAVVGKFLDDNPADRHLPAAFLVTAALTNAFPCNQAAP